IPVSGIGRIAAGTVRGITDEFSVETVGGDEQQAIFLGPGEVGDEAGEACTREIACDFFAASRHHQGGWGGGVFAGTEKGETLAVGREANAAERPARRQTLRE